MPPRIRIGTQGWNYEAWLGPFYPPETRSADMLTTYGRAFDTVEVDSTFYAIPAESTFTGWRERTPADFVFALKLPQQVTHEQRLRDRAGVTAEFFERARMLGPKLGPTLVQLAPDLDQRELPALVDFLGRIPKDVRVAIEFRHRGWINDGILALLKEHNVALALVDGRWIPRRTMLDLATRPTADFAYIRWMGPNRELVDYSRVQIDRSDELDQWTEAIATMVDKGLDVYGYVANHFSGHSPATARDMQIRVGQTPVSPTELGDQLLLF
jgi:uncharacterized protein YecE (DUF72 family)